MKLLLLILSVLILASCEPPPPEPPQVINPTVVLEVCVDKRFDEKYRNIIYYGCRKWTVAACYVLLLNPRIVDMGDRPDTCDVTVVRSTTGNAAPPQSLTTIWVADQHRGSYTQWALITRELGRAMGVPPGREVMSPGMPEAMAVTIDTQSALIAVANAMKGSCDASP